MSATPPITLDQATARGLLAANGQGIHTFSNGSEWEGWSGGNCDRCRFYDPNAAGALCALEGAALLGVVSGELATLFGWIQRTTEYGPRSGWRYPDECPFMREPPEHDENDSPPPAPDPNQLVLIADPTEDAAIITSAAVPDYAEATA